MHQAAALVQCVHCWAWVCVQRVPTRNSPLPRVACGGCEGTGNGESRQWETGGHGRKRWKGCARVSVSRLPPPCNRTTSDMFHAWKLDSTTKRSFRRNQRPREARAWLCQRRGNDVRQWHHFTMPYLFRGLGSGPTPAPWCVRVVDRSRRSGDGAAPWYGDEGSIVRSLPLAAVRASLRRTLLPFSENTEPAPETETANGPILTTVRTPAVSVPLIRRVRADPRLHGSATQDTNNDECLGNKTLFGHSLWWNHGTHTHTRPPPPLSDRKLPTSVTCGYATQGPSPTSPSSSASAPTWRAPSPAQHTARRCPRSSWLCCTPWHRSGPFGSPGQESPPYPALPSPCRTCSFQNLSKDLSTWQTSRDMWGELRLPSPKLPLRPKGSTC